MKSIHPAVTFKRSALCIAISTLLSAGLTTSAFADTIETDGTTRAALGSKPTAPDANGTATFDFYVGGKQLKAVYDLKKKQWTGVTEGPWTAGPAGSTLTYTSPTGETVSIKGEPVLKAGTLDAEKTPLSSKVNVTGYQKTTDSDLLGYTSVYGQQATLGQTASVSGSSITNAQYGSSQPYSIAVELVPSLTPGGVGQVIATYQPTSGPAIDLSNTVGDPQQNGVVHLLGIIHGPTGTPATTDAVAGTLSNAMTVRSLIADSTVNIPPHRTTSNRAPTLSQP